VPSIYEPFGMVALEAAAAGAPLAVAATGGLAEIVEPGVTGMTFPAQEPAALADAVSTLLADAEAARRMAHARRPMGYGRYRWPSTPRPSLTGHGRRPWNTSCTVRAAREVSAIAASSCATAAGTPSTRYGAVSARTAIRDMWWATTSCSSRAMRVRSSRTARR